jgi:hypothetical protein
MPEWLQDASHEGNNVAFKVLAVRLALAFLLGCVVAGIYALTQRKPRSELAPLVTTLVLLTILIAMVTLVIGNSAARAFSLVGALAIIRFRTVVEDTRDTAFVIFAVVAGMGAGAGFLEVLLLGIPMVAAAALLLGYWGRKGVVPTAAEYSLDIRLGLGRDPAALFRETFEKHLGSARLRATTTARQGAALDLSYVVTLRGQGDGVALVTDLNQVPGVQSVDLRHL